MFGSSNVYEMDRFRTLLKEKFKPEPSRYLAGFANTMIMFGYLYYEGLAKNDAQLNMLFALSNLYMARIVTPVVARVARNAPGNAPKEA